MPKTMRPPSLNSPGPMSSPVTVEEPGTQGLQMDQRRALPEPGFTRVIAVGGILVLILVLTLLGLFGIRV